jgi:hypothetical protein
VLGSKIIARWHLLPEPPPIFGRQPSAVLDESIIECSKSIRINKTPVLSHGSLGSQITIENPAFSLESIAW